MAGRLKPEGVVVPGRPYCPKCAAQRGWDSRHIASDFLTADEVRSHLRQQWADDSSPKEKGSSNEEIIETVVAWFNKRVAERKGQLARQRDEIEWRRRFPEEASDVPF